MNPPASDEGDIDLYAENLEPEFAQGDDGYDQNDALFNDVIRSSNNHGQGGGSSGGGGGGGGDSEYNEINSEHEAPQETGNGTAELFGSPTSGKRIGIYVGNLTWWTTDEDVKRAVNDCGVNDILEVKFVENRANGQSKGYCVVTLGSDQSVRTVFDKLPKMEVHGQNPIVTQCNRANLNHFEMLSSKMTPRQGQQNSNGAPPSFAPRGGYPPQQGTMPGMRPPLMGPRPGRPNPPLIPRPMAPQTMPPFQSGQPWGPRGPGGPRPPLMPTMRMGMPDGRMRERPPNPMGQPPLLRGPSHEQKPSYHSNPSVPDHQWSNDQHQHQNQHHNQHQHSQHPHHNQGPPMGMQSSSQSNLPMPRPPPHGPMHPPPGSMSGMPGMNPSIPAQLPPGAHLNPNFIAQQPPSQMSNPYGPSQPSYDNYQRSDPMPPQLSDAEIEEIMNKNRSVSASAISRAVSDAAAGDEKSAIDTLVTAIQLIRQSKVSHDDRCKFIISSLEDTLRGIESKARSSSSRDRARSRSRDRDRDRDRDRSDRRKDRRDRSRDRSRDRDSYHRERSRERDRYHERDRHHDRDRRRH